MLKLRDVCFLHTIHRNSANVIIRILPVWKLNLRGVISLRSHKLVKSRANRVLITM